MDRKVYEGYKRTKTTKKNTLTTSNAESSDEPKTPKARTTRKTTSSKPRIALFIDVDNVGISRENLLEILFYTYSE